MALFCAQDNTKELEDLQAAAEKALADARAEAQKVIAEAKAAAQSEQSQKLGAAKEVRRLALSAWRPPVWSFKTERANSRTLQRQFPT